MPDEEYIQDPLPFTPVEWTHSESLKSIAPALVAAQRRMKSPPKNSKNPHYGNMFAGLDVTMEVIKEALNAEDISILTPPTPAPAGSVGISVILLHKSGEFMEAKGFLPVDRGGPQAAGSALTYARRYFAQAALGCVGG